MDRKTKPLIGCKFGKLTVVRFHRFAKGIPFWICACSCGRSVSIRAASLLRKKRPSKSCGCSRKETGRFPNIRHGMYKTNIYLRWASMMGRCHYGSARHRFKNYAGRGIKVCRRWRKFANFLADMGEPPTDKYSLERINNNGDYEPQNVRWATCKDQGRNRRTNHNLTHNRITDSVSGWAERLGISRDTISARIRRGWSQTDTLTQPIGKHWLDTKKLTFRGITDSVPGWALRVGITYFLLHQRLKRGWTIARALTTPKHDTLMDSSREV